MRSPVAKAPILCEWAGFSCPPSCQPIGGHCRGRQSGHFLETGSLHPPPAALRRFPCLPDFAPHSLPRTRRAGCPHPAVPDLHRTSCKRCHCEAGAHTGCGNPHPPVIAPPAGHFLPTAAESTQRTPPKPIVLESFARLGYIPCEKPPTTRTECAGLPPCFRVVSAPPSAGRSRGPALP